jgi:hypothetical protein
VEKRQKIKKTTKAKGKGNGKRQRQKKQRQTTKAVRRNKSPKNGNKILKIYKKCSHINIMTFLGIKKNFTVGKITF